jgi:hypothetical protein
LDSVSCGYSFYLNQEVLVYANDVPEEGYVETGICTRTSDAETPQAQGGMPTLGCPGCEGKTMEYVEQDE